MKQHILKARLQSLLYPALCLLAALLFMWLCPEAWNGYVYKDKVYPVVRTLLNTLFGYSPVPAFSILFLGVFSYVIAVLFFSVKERSFYEGAIRLVALVFIILAAFFWLWGIHYSLPSPTVDIDSEQMEILASDVEATIEKSLETRRAFVNDSDSITPEWSFEVVEDMQRHYQLWHDKGLAILGYPSLKAARRIRYWPKGALLGVGISGMYFPFTGEPTLDRALHMLRLPSTALHEWGHSMGFTGEGDCNLIAYLAAMQSDNSFVKYSALLERLRDELYLLAILDFETYELVKNAIPDPINRDMMSIIAHHGRYRGKLSDVGHWMNDQYLKSLGVEDGLDDYWKWVIKLRKLEK